MMSSFTKFAYKSAEKAFETPPSNKKTMAAAASKGRWLLIISAFVAATADDASLRGPALRHDVALAPQGLDLGGDPTPKNAPAPQDADRRDVPPADDEAAPVGGEAGPLVTRRLEGVPQELQDAGWTVYPDMRLSDKKGGFVDWKEGDLSECAAECLNRYWCLSFDFDNGNGECFLSHSSVGQGELESSPDHDHYLAPTRQGLIKELGVRGSSPEVVPGPAAVKKLTVMVVSASDLQGEDTFGTPDVYVEVKVWYPNWGPDNLIGSDSTSVVHSLNPTWNESFEYLVTDNAYVTFTVWDQDSGADDKVGDCRIELEDVDLSATKVVVSHLTSADEKLTVALSLA